jgi:cullin-4
MASVFMLLSLPKTTNAFTAIKPTVVELDIGQTSRNPRRLGTDSDSPSALAKQWNGPMNIQITGDQCAQFVALALIVLIDLSM